MLLICAAYIYELGGMTYMIRTTVPYGARKLSHYPSSWFVPEMDAQDMFFRTDFEELSKEQPLKTRNVK